MNNTHYRTSTKGIVIMKMRGSKYLFALTALALAGCSSGGGAAGGSSGGAFANVSGLVTQTNGTSSVFSKPTKDRKPGERVKKANDVKILAESGCTIEARDMVTGAVVATTTS